MSIVGEITTEKLTTEEMERWRKAQEDSGWLREHWSEILNEYAGQSIVVAGGELFADDGVREALERARQKYPDRLPVVRYIPSYTGKWIR